VSGGHERHPGRGPVGRHERHAQAGSVERRGRAVLVRALTVVLGLSVVVPGTGGVAAGGPLVPPGRPTAGPADVVGCDRAGEHLVLTVSAVLDPGCVYTGGIEITASGVSLDCRGATVRDVDGEGGARVGILVTGPASRALHDVTVRNCRVEGFLNGVRITREGFRSLPEGAEYADAHHDIVVEDSEVRDARGVGVFVDAYVTRVTLRRLVVEGAGSAGVYLEAGSRDNVVRDNRIVGNGFRQNGPAGQHVELGGGLGVWFWGVGREGIAVDGSTGNRIVGNHLEGNAAGGVFLYKNCGEYVHQRPEVWWQRRQGADGNLIAGNVIVGGLAGVWVGSRMGENTLPMDCSDPAYVDEPLLRVTLDRAVGNVVRGNVVRDVTYGVRVEDDDTRVEANHIGGTDPAALAVVVGTRWRTERLGRPVAGTTILANTADIAGNASPYRYVHGHVGTTFRGNLAAGRPAVLCEAPPLPAAPFIFVVAFVPHRAGDPPPPPPPDLAPPRPAVLEPCPAPEPSADPVAVAGPARPGAPPVGGAGAGVPVAPRFAG
jgi:parallel beta-helix repeat protein